MKWRPLAVVSVALLLPLLLFALAVGTWLFLRQGGFAALTVPRSAAAVVVPSDPATVDHGRYLARLGNCEACHTPRGAPPYSGGRAFHTGYGTVYSSNLTSDPTHGIGDWSTAEFRHAMRHGVSRNGLQSPVFPYANFARLTDADLDALFAYLRTLPPVAVARPPNALTFPATLPGAMLVWRMLHHVPASPPDATVAARDADASSQARGRYLVDGIAHCALCHGRRGSMGALDPSGNLAGGTVPGAGWYAPPLDRHQLARYDTAQLAHYLRTGTSAHGDAYGLMADVVQGSTTHLTDADARAMADYLRTLPEHARPAPPPRAMQASAAHLRTGEALYAEHCAGCHGDDGEGTPGKYPPLRGSVAVTAPDAVNAVRLVLYGGIAPTTAGNPRPYSMPPFAQRFSADDVAAVVNHIRTRWGDPPRAITPDEIGAFGGPVAD